jgi:hypothetical protein
MEFFRNWNQICKIDDLNLRLALALIQDQNLLEGLRRGFPHCFSSKPTKQPLVPASVLRVRARQESVKEDSSYSDLQRVWDEEMRWYNFGILHEFGIPEGPRWSAEDGETVPIQIRKQLIGQTIGCGMKVVWQGEEYLASYLYDIPETELGKTFREEHVDLVTILHLIPAKFVDLNA